jgi:hypothetical protein
VVKYPKKATTMTNQNVSSPDRVASATPVLPPGTPSWVTPALVERTIIVWQPHYPERLTTEQAVEMILAIGWLFGQP